VTDGAISARVLKNLQHNLGRVSDLQEQLSSGKLLNRPSDSPTGTVSAMQLRGDVRSEQQFVRNTEDGIGWLGTLDTALTSSVTQVGRVRDLMLQGMSAGAAGSAEGREALAVEVDNIRQALVSLANTKYLDRPVFGGTTAGGVAYHQDGSYAGNTGEVVRTIGTGSTVRVDIPGPEAFGTGAHQLFEVLTSVAANLRTNPAALNGDLDRLDTTRKTITTKLADVGARYNRVEHMRENALNRVLSLRSQLSEVEDIDLPGTIMEMQLQQTAYQAALAASAKVMQPSLIDFLR
jgi:flagellar hook-associated protein 3 FlgL